VLVPPQPAHRVRVEGPEGLGVLEGQQTAVGDASAVARLALDFKLLADLGVDAIAADDQIDRGGRAVLEACSDLLPDVLRRSDLAQTSRIPHTGQTHLDLDAALSSMQRGNPFSPNGIEQHVEQLGAVHRQLLHVAFVEIGADGDDLRAIVEAPHRAMDVVPPSRDGIGLLADAHTMQDLGGVDPDAHPRANLRVLRCLFVDVDVQAGTMMGQRERTGEPANAAAHDCDAEVVRLHQV
jgi:hypothetical protein